MCEGVNMPNLEVDVDEQIIKALRAAKPHLVKFNFTRQMPRYFSDEATEVISRWMHRYLERRARRERVVHSKVEVGGSWDLGTGKSTLWVSARVAAVPGRGRVAVPVHWRAS